MKRKPDSIQQIGSSQKLAGILGCDWPIWILAAVCSLAGLGVYGVANNNEGLYGYIAFDMATSGNIIHWIIPHLNGLPYLEKPPMLYWLTAIAILIFGQTEWVVRLVPALSAMACVGLILYFGKRVYREPTARLAALMFISSVGVMIMARTLLFDMLFTAFLIAALFFFYLFQIERRKVDLRIAYASLACAVLTKGLVALILFGLVILAWLVVLRNPLSAREGVLKGSPLVGGGVETTLSPTPLPEGEGSCKSSTPLLDGEGSCKSMWGKLTAWLDPIAIGLFFLICAPWFIAASVVEPIFPWFFFINEHVLRFLGRRIPHDFQSGPWWYYLPRMLLGMLPWSLLFPIALLTKYKKLSGAELRESSDLKNAMLWAWVLPLIFFSISNAKANYYMIVVVPIASLYLALLLEQSNFLYGPRSAILGGIMAVVFVICAMLWHLYQGLFIRNEVVLDLFSVHLARFDLSLTSFGLIVFYFFAGLSLSAALIAWRFPSIGLSAYAVLPVLCLAVSLLVGTIKDEWRSDRAVAHFIQETLPDRKVYLYRQFEQHSSDAFYLRRPIVIIDSNSNDLYWGNKLRPKNTVMIGSEQLSEQLSEQPALQRPVVVVPDEFLDEFMHTDLPVHFNFRKSFKRVEVFY